MNTRALKRSFVAAVALAGALTVGGAFSLASQAQVNIPAASDHSQLQGRYFMQVWSYEGPGNRPKDAHTFAAFYSGDDLAAGRTNPATISWLPEKGPVRPGVTKGKNFSLTETLNKACSSHKAIRSWGPYEITADLYHRGRARARLLESGRVKYSMLGFSAKAPNCIGAAGDLTDTPFTPGPVWGAKASQYVVRHLSPQYSHGTKVNKTVADLIGWPGCQ